VDRGKVVFNIGKALFCHKPFKTGSVLVKNRHPLPPNLLRRNAQETGGKFPYAPPDIILQPITA